MKLIFFVFLYFSATSVIATLFPICRCLVSRKLERPTRAPEFTEWGDLPKVRSAYAAVARSSTIIVLNSNNSTIVSASSKSSSCLTGERLDLNPFHAIGDKLYLAVTGFSGDARLLVRQAKRFVLQHSVDFGTAPSGSQISLELSGVLQRATSGARPLAVHLFVIDNSHATSKKCLIFEIDSSGIWRRVHGGIAGRGATANKHHMFDKRPMDSPATKMKCEAVLQKIHLSGVDKNADGGETTGTELDAIPIQHFELFHW